MNPVSITISSVALLLSLLAYRANISRTDVTRAYEFHRDLTTGEVAAARRKLGAQRYSNPGPLAIDAAQELRDAYFVLLWSFERVSIGRQALTKSSILGTKSLGVRTLDDSIRWHIDEWAETLRITKPLLEASLSTKLVDRASWSGLEHLEKALHKK